MKDAVPWARALFVWPDGTRRSYPEPEEPETTLGTAMAEATNGAFTAFAPSSGLTALALQSIVQGGNLPVMLYMGGSQWDQVGKRFHLVAKAQGQGTQWVHGMYDAIEDEWVVVSRSTSDNVLPGADSAGFGHMYDGVAVDPATGLVYHTGWGQGAVGRYNGTSWSSISASTMGVSAAPSDTPVLKVHAARNELLLARAGTSTLRVLDLSDDSVTSGGSFSLGVATHPVGGYNPVREEFVFGGGDNGLGGTRSRVVYRYDATGTLERIDDTPAGFGLSVEDGALFGVDYATGDTLVYWYDPISFDLSAILRLDAAGEWSVESVPSGAVPSYGACCVTIPEYQGDVFVDYNGGSPRFVLRPTRGA